MQLSVFEKKITICYCYNANTPLCLVVLASLFSGVSVLLGIIFLQAKHPDICGPNPPWSIAFNQYFIRVYSMHVISCLL